MVTGSPGTSPFGKKDVAELALKHKKQFMLKPVGRFKNSKLFS